MSTNTLIQNISRGDAYFMRFRQAVRAIENCACAWVEYGKSVRDLSISEAIQARNSQAAEREPLPLAEIPGFRVKNLPNLQEEITLAREAQKFVAMRPASEMIQ